MSAVALVLAAGSSRRFGSDKRRARLGTGQSLVERAVATVNAAGLHCYLAVPAGDTLAASGAEVVEVHRHGRGMGATIAEAVAQLPEDVAACLILPVDLPGLQAATLARVAALASEHAIVVPVHAGRRGHPVAFGRELFPELCRLDGDAGARSVIAAHPDRVIDVAVEDAGIHTDIDTPEALHQFELQRLM